METLIAAVLQRKNVVFFSYEMPLQQINTRILKRITGMATPEGGNFDIPVFDCAKNQDGSCTLPLRTGFNDLVDRSGSNPTIRSYSREIDWIPCTACRNDRRNNQYDPASWKVSLYKPAQTETEFRKKVDAFMKLYARYCRCIFHPSRSAEVSVIESELDTLIARENFIADLTVLDYADLVKAKSNIGQKRLELDDIWESLRSLGQQRRMAVITASQTSKQAVEAKFIKQTDIAEDFSKIAKVDLGVGLAQTEDMKLAGILNANIVAYRHGPFLTSKVCTILQDNEAMQGILDSDF